MENFTITIPMKFENPNYQPAVPKAGKYSILIEVPETTASKTGKAFTPEQLLQLMVKAAAYKIKNELFWIPKE